MNEYPRDLRIALSAATRSRPVSRFLRRLFLKGRARRGDVFEPDEHVGKRAPRLLSQASNLFGGQMGSLLGHRASHQKDE